MIRGLVHVFERMTVQNISWIQAFSERQND